MSPAGLAGRRVLVTGGSMGIGRSVCQALAESGASVIVAARGLEAVGQTANSLPGGEHVGLQLDVTVEDSWQNTMREIDAGGPLDGVVTAAGVLGPIGSVDAIDPDEFRLTIEVNLIGTMLALHHCLPRLEARGGAAVTFSGGGSTSPLPRYDAYAASKAAVVRLTENVAALADERGIRVNCISPGFVATRMHEGTLAAGAGGAGAEYYERTVAQLADGGVAPERPAALVCFLLSDDAAGINGKLISAPWDPWQDESFRERLRTDRDLAALRRIDEQFFARSAS